MFTKIWKLDRTEVNLKDITSELVRTRSRQIPSCFTSHDHFLATEILSSKGIFLLSNPIGISIKAIIHQKQG